VLHVAAVTYYLWRGENLVAPMIRGDKPVALAVASSRALMLALVVLSLCSLAIWGLLKLGS
jgi:hypothetical protein